MDSAVPDDDRNRIVSVINGVVVEAAFQIADRASKMTNDLLRDNEQKDDEDQLMDVESKISKKQKIGVSSSNKQIISKQTRTN